MSFYIYILKCSDGSYYTGHTDNLEMRIAGHQMGEIPGYSFTRRPVNLVFSEEFPTRVDAIERERQIKRWSRHKKEALIKQDWDRLKQLARSRGSTSSPRTEPI
ncbi:MAG: GIY-YIG nuclease family protein [Chloroflexi bacterium]|nr:GIY-YIG nuclease family protein [Chloroflexota bacterium]